MVSSTIASYMSTSRSNKDQRSQPVPMIIRTADHSTSSRSTPRGRSRLEHHLMNFFGLENSAAPPVVRSLLRASSLRTVNSGSSARVVSWSSRCVYLVRPDRPKFLTCMNRDSGESGVGIELGVGAATLQRAVCACMDGCLAASHRVYGHHSSASIPGQDQGFLCQAQLSALLSCSSWLGQAAACS